MPSTQGRLMSSRTSLGLGAFEDLTIPTRSGAAVPVTQVARVHYEFEEPILWRRNRDLVLTVRGDVVDGVQAPDVSQEIKPQLKSIEAALPFGYRISVRQLSDSEMDKRDTNADGIWDDESKTIYIRKRLPVTRRRYILAHELGHAWLDWQHRYLDDGKASAVSGKDLVLMGVRPEYFEDASLVPRERVAEPLAVAGVATPGERRGRTRRHGPPLPPRDRAAP